MRLRSSEKRDTFSPFTECFAFFQKKKYIDLDLIIYNPYGLIALHRKPQKEPWPHTCQHGISWSTLIKAITEHLIHTTVCYV